VKLQIAQEIFDRVFAQLIETAHGNSKEKGFWGSDDGLDLSEAVLNPRDEIDQVMGVHILLSKLMLIVTEVAEAAEDARAGGEVLGMYFNSAGKPEGLLVELADIIIRVGDLAGVIEKKTGRKLSHAIAAKMAYNHGRPTMHGKRA
jgi:NTP pyrophosphatase (non-canonical NTP hydrolase)